MLTPTRSTYLDTAALALEAVAAPEVAGAWDRPSCVAGMTVGAVAAHLVFAGIDLVPPYLEGPEPPGVRAMSAGGLFAGLALAQDAEIHVGTRARSTAAASSGVADLLAAARTELAAMPRRLDDLPPDRRITVMSGIDMRLDDYLVTRVVEMVVHLDDLAASVGIDMPAVPVEAFDMVVSCLTATARRRHGDLAVVRALARRERAADGVFPVF